MRQIVILFLSILFLNSCISQKAEDTSNIKKISNKNESSVGNKYFYNAILKKPDFEAIKITSKIDFQKIPHINATIYIENNQKIWINISALFINIARGIATPQGIKVYEKMDKTYIDSDFSYLNQLLNVNFLDYNAVQNLLLGRLFIPISESDFDFITSTDGYILKSKKSQKITVNENTNEYLIEFKFSKQFDLTQAILQDVQTNDLLDLFYENWLEIGGQRLPKNVKIIIKGKKSKQILIENTKFEFSKIKTPYSVPNNYQKRELK